MEQRAINLRWAKMLPQGCGNCPLYLIDSDF